MPVTPPLLLLWCSWGDPGARSCSLHESRELGQRALLACFGQRVRLSNCMGQTIARLVGVLFGQELHCRVVGPVAFFGRKLEGQAVSREELGMKLELFQAAWLGSAVLGRVALHEVC